MKLEANLSAGAVQAILVAGGGALAYGLWAVLSGMIGDFKYEPVFGEQLGGTTQVAQVSSVALPIVIAASEAPAEQNVMIATDDMIEAAFKVPEPEVEETVKPAISKAVLFSMLYRPTVGGMAGNGVFLNGRYVRVGEELSSMPLRLADGSVLIPRLASVSRSNVIFTIGDESVSIPVKLY